MKFSIKFIRQTLLIIGIIAATAWLCRCKTEVTHMPEAEFTRIENGVFMIEQDTFFPLMLNYVVSFRDFNGHFVVSPHLDYDNIGQFESNDEEAIEKQLSAHFKLISDLGFNSIRLCFDRMVDDNSGNYYYPTDNRNFSIVADSAAIFSGLETLISIANAHNLKVMLLLKPPFNAQLNNYTKILLQHFSNNTNIFAFDMMNEPLYFDITNKRSKKSAYKIVNKWKQMIRENAPNHLFTIGFSEPIEVFEWDPYLLPVDFVEIHTYHPLRVANEMYWYNHYIGKPWMVGETALPSDNDSISYAEQTQFMIDAYRCAIDNGAIGFGWWEYQDVVGVNYEACHSGLLDHHGQSINSTDTFQGSLKPAAFEVRNLLNYEKHNSTRPVNYYNMLGYNNIMLKGSILDKKTKQGIEGAVIRGWNEYWNVGLNTFSDSCGNFTLYSNDFCVHFEVSAPGMSKVKFNQSYEYQQIDKNYSLENLPNQKLEYHSISYHTFLNDSTKRKSEHYPLFSFDSIYFNQTKFEADMGNIYLKQLNY